MANINTNCGVITPSVYEDILCKIPGVDITHNKLQHFHHMVCQWAYNIPLNFLWVMVIEMESVSLANLKKDIRLIEKNYEPEGWNMGKTAEDTWTWDTQDKVGCIFAQAAELPGETTSVERVGIIEGSRRGFINAPIISGRQDFNDLSVTFLETNRSFVEGFIRPWSILAMHKGLIAQPKGKSIKSTINLYELAKKSACEPNIIRKHWVFKDAVPTQISSESKTQENSSDYGKRQVSFTFGSYYITDHSIAQNIPRKVNKFDIPGPGIDLPRDSSLRTDFNNIG